jgi:hypothetical protein
MVLTSPSKRWLLVAAASYVALLHDHDGTRATTVAGAAAVQGDGDRPARRPGGFLEYIRKRFSGIDVADGSKEPDGPRITPPPSPPTQVPTIMAKEEDHESAASCPESPPYGGRCAVEEYLDVMCRYDYKWTGCEEPLTCQDSTFCRCDDSGGGTWMCAQMGMEQCPGDTPERFGQECVP